MMMMLCCTSSRPLLLLLLFLLLLNNVQYCIAEEDTTTATTSSSSSADHNHDVDRDDDELPDEPSITTTTKASSREEEEEDLLIDDDDSLDLVPDFLIVGAGGGGIQMALYLQKYGYTYKIFEKSTNIGNFWTKFPIFDELISVNKYVDDESQAMRYDWHSLLETPNNNIKMWQNITEDYFPKGIDWHNYMYMVAKEANILPHIIYNTEVDMILPGNDNDDDNNNDDHHHHRPCLLLSSGIKRCAKHKIFVATGLKEREEPFLRAIGGIRYSEIPNYIKNKDEQYYNAKKKPKPGTNYFKHRRICILGNGNSGFEIGQNLYKIASKVVIYGKEPHRLSSVTRYTGDIRTKYLQVLENHNAKLLDDVGYFFWWKKDDQKTTKGFDSTTRKWIDHYQLNITESHVTNTIIRILYFLIDFQCDTLILTTGFESSVPDGLDMINDDDTDEKKNPRRRFPKTKDWYESTINPNVHVLGWLMHERDFRRGAGGFLSGYRYLIRNLFYHIHSDIHQNDDQQPYYYPHYVFTKSQVIEHVVKRVQTADDLIILQDGVIIRDAIIKIDDFYYHYYEGITYNFHHHDLLQQQQQQEDEDQNDDIDNKEEVPVTVDGEEENNDGDEEVTSNDDDEEQQQQQQQEKTKKDYEYVPIYLYFTWGDGRDTDTVFEAQIRYDSGRLMNRFLHPAIEIGTGGELVREVHEDLEMEWKLPGYEDAVRRAITQALELKHDNFKPRTFYPYERKDIPHPPDRPTKQSKNFEVADLRKRREPTEGEIDFKSKREEIPKLIPIIAESVSKYYNPHGPTTRSEGIEQLTTRVKQFLPSMFEYEDFWNDGGSEQTKQQAAVSSHNHHHQQQHHTWNDGNVVDFEKKKKEEDDEEEEDSYVPAGSCDEVFEEEEDDEKDIDSSPSLSKSSPATGQDDSSTASSSGSSGSSGDGGSNTVENLKARLGALETKLEAVVSGEL